MNIILIISDTFRYDNLFDRASMPVRTPNLDAFSKRAVSCSRMYVSSFPTIPHRTDVTTGRYGWPWYGWQNIRRSGRNQAPAMLRQAGYASQLICDCPHLFDANFQHAFDGKVQVRGQEGDVYLTRLNDPFVDVMPPAKTRTSRHTFKQILPTLSSWTNRRWYREQDRFAPRIAETAVEWLEENYQHRPFFLWVDFFDPHEPWDAPEYMVRKYDPQYTGTPMVHPNYGRASDYTKAELRNLRAHYCAEAELVDRWAGRVLQKIDDLDLWENSVVVFTTDHGMSLGEHNRTGKENINTGDKRCWPLYPEIAHIPFMVAAPGLKGGRTVRELVQPPDILPTLAELAGAKLAPPDRFHGRSFARLLRGKPSKQNRDFVITGECLRGMKETKPQRRVTPVLYTKKWAYAPFGAKGSSELFNITADPYAEKNIIQRNRNVAARLHAKFVKWLREMDAPEDTLALYSGKT